MWAYRLREIKNRPNYFVDSRGQIYHNDKGTMKKLRGEKYANFIHDLRIELEKQEAEQTNNPEGFQDEVNKLS